MQTESLAEQKTKPFFEENVGNIMLMEHVNVQVPDQALATLFYLVGMGLIIGAATAMRLTTAHPRLKIGLIEKESAIASHQTGNNSGVIHSGIYYAPGSQKAQNCVIGVGLLKEFCDEHDIEYELCGKVIVATSEDQLPRLDELFRRGQANGVQGLEMIDAPRLHEIEPHVAGIHREPLGKNATSSSRRCPGPPKWRRWRWLPAACWPA